MQRRKEDCLYGFTDTFACIQPHEAGLESSGQTRARCAGRVELGKETEIVHLGLIKQLRVGTVTATPRNALARVVLWSRKDVEGPACNLDRARPRCATICAIVYRLQRWLTRHTLAANASIWDLVERLL